MKVGLLTTWNTPDAVAEYSRTLVEGLLTREDIELTVLGSRNQDEQALAEPEEFVLASFDVMPSERDGRDQLDVEPILALGLDVLHVQYTGGLYNLPRLNELLRRFEGLRVVTWHDNVAPEGLEWNRFDAAVTHREGVGPGAPEVLAHPVRSLPPLVRTFGSGRTREDVIRPVCERNGWVFESLAQTPDAAANPWKAWQDLHDWLRGADAIVLWYDDDPLAGSSGAARTAIATRRPVIVNDTSWFADLPQQSGAFYKVRDDPAALQATLREILRQDSMIERWSPQASANRHVALYQAALERRAAEPQAPPARRGLRGALRQALETLGARLAGLRRLRARLVLPRRLRRRGAEAGGDPPAAL